MRRISAVALAEESKQSTLLIDLNLHLGDAAMNLGLQTPYSIVDALDNSSRLNSTMLHRYISHHSSGLAVLAAPIQLPAIQATTMAIGCVIAAARQNFHYVVVDAGKKIDLKQMHLFEESSTSYLVTQVGIPELRNANRLILQFSTDHSPKLEIIVNRHQSRFLGLTDEHLAKALTQPVRWKIPNDYAAVRKMQSDSVPLVEHDSHIAGVIREMARSACGIADSASSVASRNIIKGAFRLPRRKKTKPGNAEPLYHRDAEPPARVPPILCVRANSPTLADLDSLCWPLRSISEIKPKRWGILIILVRELQMLTAVGLHDDPSIHPSARLQAGGEVNPDALESIRPLLLQIGGELMVEQREPPMQKHGSKYWKRGPLERERKRSGASRNIDSAAPLRLFS